MKIAKVQIKDFRGIDSLDLDFTGPDGKPLDLVVLAGPNGCGKTSVLEACLIAFGWPEDLGGRARAANNVRFGANDYKVRLTVIDNKGISHLLTGSKGKRTSTIVGGVSPAPGTPPRPPMRFLGFQVPRPTPSPPTGPIEYFSSWRVSPFVGSLPVVVGKRDKKSRPPEDIRLRTIKEYLVNWTAMNAFRGEPDSASPQPKDEDVFSRINRAWKIFYPQHEDRFVAKLAKEATEENIVFDVYLVDEKTRREVPLDVLSSGEIEIFTMLGWSAIRDFAQGLLFVDEPELHLHPAWHRTILRALRTVLPHTQIICATHSPEILDAVYSYERFTLLPFDDPRILLANGAPEAETKT